jgi:phosphoglycolate phosphatase
MPGYSHVVWDWNGTLLNDAAVCVAVMNQMLGRRGLPPISMDFYRSVIEFPVVIYYKKLGFDFGSEPFEHVSDEFVALYQASWRSCALQEGSLTAMAALKAAGVGQSVLSASKSGHLTEQLDYFGITSLLDAVTGADNHHGRGKLNLARDHVLGIGQRPENVVFIGDTEHDAEVAREAGCGCILVSFGHYCAARLANLGFPVAGSMLEAVEHILSALR